MAFYRKTLSASGLKHGISYMRDGVTPHKNGSTGAGPLRDLLSEDIWLCQASFSEPSLQPAAEPLGVGTHPNRLTNSCPETPDGSQALRPGPWDQAGAGAQGVQP